MHPILEDRRRLALYLLAWLLAGVLLTIGLQSEAEWLTSAAVLLPLCLLYSFIGLSTWYLCRAFPIDANARLSTLVVVQVAATCVTGASPSPALYEHIATSSLDLGHYSVVPEDGGTAAIVISHGLIGEFLNPAPSGPPNGYAPQQPEQYSELTTDIAGRDNPYAPPNPNATAPFPAQGSPFSPPSPNGTAPYPAQGPNGAGPDFSGPDFSGPDFSGPASRATVTPPSPDDTTNWPSRDDQSRFDQFKPDSQAAPAKPDTPRVRMLPILIAVVVGAVLLLGVALGVVYLVAGDKSKAISVSTGDCVKRDGNAAVKADCGDASSFTVVSIVDDHTKCEDPKQPYVQNPTNDGKTQILCLKPKS